MIDIAITPQFRRLFRKLLAAVQEEAYEKLVAFKDPAQHASLHVHKLHGVLANQFSFRVNYKYRILFVWESKGSSVILVSIGDHVVYD